MVLLAARGTSDHAALYAKYLVEVRCELPGRPGLAVDDDRLRRQARPARRADARDQPVRRLAGPDPVAGGRPRPGCADRRRHQQRRLAAGRRRQRLHVDVLAGPERAVAATKSYTAQLLALYLLLDTVAAGSGAARDARCPTSATSCCEQEHRRSQALAQRYRFAQRLVTTARGYSYPTAREAALKLMETSYLSAQAFSGADLMHGPLAMHRRAGPGARGRRRRARRSGR